MALTKTIRVPDGFVPVDPDKPAGQFIGEAVLTCANSFYPGQAVQFSNGLLVDGDAATEASNFAGVYLNPIVSSASTSNSSTGNIDRRFFQGGTYYVVASDTTITEAKRGLPASIGTDAKKVLISGATGPLFVVDEIVDTTNNIVKVRFQPEFES